MPTSKMPTTLNCFRRGMMPAGVTSPCGAISVTLSPVKHAKARARSAPSTMPNSPGCRSSRLPLFMWLAKSATCVFQLRQDAAHHRALHRLVVGQHALRHDVGRRCRALRDAARALPATPGQSASAPSIAADLACAKPRPECACAIPSGSRSSPTAPRSAPPRRGRCRAWKSGK